MQSLKRTPSGQVICYVNSARANNFYNKFAPAAGYGIVFGTNHPWNTSSRVYGGPTEEVAEIEGAAAAIERAGKHNIDQLQIRTDALTLQCLYNRYKNVWSNDKWEDPAGETVEDRERWRDLRNVINKYKMDVQIVKVRRRVDDELNEESNRLAQVGVYKYEQKLDLFCSSETGSDN